MLGMKLSDCVSLTEGWVSPVFYPVLRTLAQVYSSLPLVFTVQSKQALAIWTVGNVSGLGVNPWEAHCLQAVNNAGMAVWSRVFFTMAHTDVPVNFLELTTAAGARLTLSPPHILYKAVPGRGASEPRERLAVPASDVQVCRAPSVLLSAADSARDAAVLPVRRRAVHDPRPLRLGEESRMAPAGYMMLRGHQSAQVL